MTPSRGARQLLLHGLALVMAGLLWGLIVPHTPFPRLALGAHIQFESSGLLFIVTGMLLLHVPHRAGTKTLIAMLCAAWLTWLMAFSEVANAWWGTLEMLPIAAKAAGAAGGTPWQESIVKGTHIAAGLALIVAWAMLIAGFAIAPAPAPARDTAESSR
jgi:hydroxylaminobenzene mutase